MKTLDKIVGGTINFNGGIDVNYQSTGCSVARDGSIRDGYLDSGFRIARNGLINDGYNTPTGAFLDSVGVITKY